jgi:hypothetical protein
MQTLVHLPKMIILVYMNGKVLGLSSKIGEIEPSEAPKMGPSEKGQLFKER